jgi:hypothetical protein
MEAIQPTYVIKLTIAPASALRRGGAAQARGVVGTAGAVGPPFG